MVEVDGGQHLDREAADRSRGNLIEARGYRVLRFWNSDVLSNLDAVLERILSALKTPSPYPLPGQGEGILNLSKM